MGYMGLKTYGQSDNAADIMGDVMDGVLKALATGFRATRKSNCYNTDGAVNVCLILETGLLDNAGRELEYRIMHNEKLFRMFKNVHKDMVKNIKGAKDKEEWDSESNRKDHLRAFTRMHKKFLSVMRKAGITVKDLEA